MKGKGGALKLLIILEVIALALVIGLGQVRRITSDSESSAKTGTSANTASQADDNQASDATQEASDENATETADTLNNENSFGDQNPRQTYSDEVEAKIAEMTLEEKVAQMFLVSPEALTQQTSEKVTISGEATKNAINTYPVGGVVYTSDNMMGTEQLAELLSNVRAYSQERIGLDLFTAVSEPGGEDGSVVANLCLYEKQAGIGELGEQEDSAASESAASEIGTYLLEKGFSMNLAPVADVAGLEDTSGETFGTDPDVVADQVSAQIRGYKTSGVVAVMGKFPGTHDLTVEEGSLPVCNRTLEELQVADFVSFQAGIDAGAQVIMLANVSSRELTGTAALPCSLSANVVTTLRDDMGFTGVILSDNLNDETVTASYADGSAAVEAVKAGVNMLYTPTDFVTAYQAVLDAVNDGSIDEDNIDDSVGRILTIKMAE